MPKSFNVEALRARIPNVSVMRDPNMLLRAALAVLVVANLVAAILIFKPLGGSPEDMEQQVRALQAQIRQRETGLKTMRTVASKVEKGRADGNAFLGEYFLGERVAYSAVLTEINRIANESKMKVKEHTFASEPIEGSADLNVMSINGNYEGTYANLMQFVNLLDRSKQLIIIESLQAQPQQTAGTLSIVMKLNTFVREAKAQ
jgi:type IV pilus assembly protein PilO